MREGEGEPIAPLPTRSQSASASDASFGSKVAERPVSFNAPPYLPPMIERPDTPPGFFEGMRMFAKDILSVFPKKAYRRRLFRFRALRRDVVVVNAPDLVGEAFIARHEALQRKSPQMRRALEPLLGDGLFVSDGEVWRTRRAAVSPIVHAKAVPTFFPVMADVAAEWRDQWTAHADGPPVDVLAEMGNMTAEIISRSVFGTRLGREHTGEIVAGFAEFQRHVDRINLAALLGLPGWVPTPHNAATRRSVRRIHRVIDDLVARLIADRDNPETAGCFVARMLDARDPEGRPFSPTAVRNESIVTFMAGHETTANTLAWALYMLSEAGWARTRLLAECDAVLAGRVPTLADMPKLPYTRAVIEETLRLYPPVPLLGREAVADTELDGTTIRRGTQVTVAPWLLHRNPKVWVRPNHFVPERFLEGAPRPAQHAYAPFAIGPRICPGMVFGLTEAIVCLAVLAPAFHLKTADGFVVRPIARGTLRPGDTLPMTIMRREVAPSAHRVMNGAAAAGI